MNSKERRIEKRRMMRESKTFSIAMSNGFLTMNEAAQRLIEFGKALSSIQPRRAQ